jgi:hypothetical protein
MLLEEDASILGFNVGINSGDVAGQTIMHSHVSDPTSDLLRIDSLHQYS